MRPVSASMTIEAFLPADAVPHVSAVATAAAAASFAAPTPAGRHHCVKRFTPSPLMFCACAKKLIHHRLKKCGFHVYGFVRIYRHHLSLDGSRRESLWFCHSSFRIA